MKTTPKTVKRTVADRHCTVLDALKTCRAAAALVMRGENYSYADREDAASALILLVMERADADTLRSGMVPVKLIGMDFLCKRATDAKRKLDLAAGRSTELESGPSDDGDTGESTATRQLTVHGSSAAPDASPLNDGTPWGARRAALAMLADAGLWEGSRSGKLAPNVHANVDTVQYPQGVLFDERRDTRTVRASAPTGPLWTLAYSAARAQDGLDAREIAAELELTDATHRQHLSRAAKMLRAYGPDADGVLTDDGATVAGAALRSWVDALNVDGCGAEYASGILKRRERASQRDYSDAPVKTGKVARRTVDRGSEWSRPQTMRTRNGKRWTLDPLAPLQRARLEKGVALRRSRLAQLSDAERASARRAAGLPSTAPA